MDVFLLLSGKTRPFLWVFSGLHFPRGAQSVFYKSSCIPGYCNLCFKWSH